jgi:glutaminyl-peptide cyclotransferase
LVLAGCGDEVDSIAEQAEEAELAEGDEGAVEVVTYDVVVVNRYPHDEGAYTQGLEFVDGQLLESTGRIGTSSIRLVDPDTGTVIEQQPLAGTLYGEGATLVGDEVWQLTYQSETVIVHRLDGLAEDRRYAYDGEGWGLCYTGTRLLMSNGSDELAVREPESFAEVGSIPVTLNGEPVEKLNELECVGQLVWANVYQTNDIVAISGASGEVVGVADLSELVPEGFEDTNDFVLNGIAYNPETERFWVTGKQWPVMYEIELVPQP